MYSVVDDIQLNIDVAKVMLKMLGIESNYCNTGEDAIKMIKEGGYSHVFLDIEMPGMGGVDTLSMIREFDKELNVLAFTANAMEGDKEKGFNGYIIKPLELESLKKMMG